MIDLDTLCADLVDLTGIRRSEWNSIELSTKSPKRNRTIVQLGSSCYHYTRLNQDELTQLRDEMFGKFPTDHYTFEKRKFSYEETMLIALHYMALGTKYYEMKDTYGGDWTLYSYMVNYFARFLYHKYYHRLCGRSMEFWAEHVPVYREAIWKYVCTDGEGNLDIDVLLQFFRVFGWIDCMQHETCTPASGPINADNDRNDDMYLIQRAFFTAYGKMHGTKTQALHLPDGMVGNVYFSSVAQNDKGVVNISGIEEELERILTPYKIQDEHGTEFFPALYGDEIYELSSVIVKRNGANDKLHDRLTSARIDIEHLFGVTASLFKRLSVKYTWKLVHMKHHVREHLFSIFFMVNCYSCFRGNKSATKYGLQSPTIGEYLNVNATHRYDGEEADEWMADHLKTQAP